MYSSVVFQVMSVVHLSRWLIHLLFLNRLLQVINSCCVYYFFYNLTCKTTIMMVAGLKDCRWPGRCQTFTEREVTWYMDGAHTPESLDVCVKWFKQAAADEERSLGYVCALC